TIRYKEFFNFTRSPASLQPPDRSKNQRNGASGWGCSADRTADTAPISRGIAPPPAGSESRVGSKSPQSAAVPRAACRLYTVTALNGFQAKIDVVIVDG